MKEVVIEIKEDLKAHIIKSDKDAELIVQEFTKRPTWGQMMSLLGGVGVIVTIVVSMVGG